MAGFIALQQLAMNALQGGKVNGLAGGAPLAQQPQQQSTSTSAGVGQNSRSFEDILRQNDLAPAEPGGGGTAAAPTGAMERSAGVSGSGLERLRLDLMERYRLVPPGASKSGALLPELIESDSRMKMLREAMNSAQPGAKNTDLRGRFSMIETEWAEVEKIMRSNKDLSQGELLGLQARLYQVSQHIEVMSKVVDQMTGGVKTILNTNV